MNTNNSTNQYLLNYKEDFKNDPRWINKESAHYIFNYFVDSVADTEIDQIEKTQEESFEKIVTFLKIVPPKEKIRYYLYPSPEIKKELMGDDGYAQAVHKDYSIHVIYTEEHKPIGEHEDTHLLSLPLGSATGFFAEGLAEFLSWDRVVLGKTKEQWFEEGRSYVLPIEKIVSHQDWMHTPDDNFMHYYSFAGFFVKKIIEKFEVETFKDFYRSIDRNMDYENISDKFYNFFKISLTEFV